MKADGARMARGTEFEDIKSISEQLQAFSNKCEETYGLISEKKEALRAHLWIKSQSSAR